LATVEVMVSVSDADLVLFAIEVAWTVAWLLGEVGAVAGGVYVTDVVVLPESEPQLVEGGHVSVQVTPLSLESFWTAASKLVPAVPASTELTWLIVTVIGTAAVIVNASVSDFVLSVTDVAVSVGLLFGDEGTEVGGA
jgi:hypothetical protein